MTFRDKRIQPRGNHAAGLSLSTPFIATHARIHIIYCRDAIHRVSRLRGLARLRLRCRASRPIHRVSHGRTCALAPFGATRRGRFIASPMAEPAHLRLRCRASRPILPSHAPAPPRNIYYKHPQPCHPRAPPPARIATRAHRKTRRAHLILYIPQTCIPTKY